AWLALGFITTVGQGTNSPKAAVNFDLKKVGIKAIGDWQIDPVQTQELDQIFASAAAAANAISPSVDAGAQQHAVNNALRAELETFLSNHRDSAYAPAVHI